MHKKRVGSHMSTAEASGLQFQYRLFAREMGALIPSAISRTDINAVLDVGCGPGSWVVDLARTSPKLNITGIDKNPEMVRLASKNAQAAGLHTVSFQVGDLLKGLPYAEARFDLVHVQRGSTFIAPQKWPEVIAELLYVTRPGGWIHLIDFEPGLTSSPAIDTFAALVGRGLVQAGYSISPSGQAFTCAILYPRFLTQAGCTQVNYALYPVNLGGVNNFVGDDYMTAMLSDDQRVLAFLVKVGIINQAELDELLLKMREEIQQVDFCGTGMIISAVGRKPEAGVK